jgi:hypothetical protein
MRCRNNSNFGTEACARVKCTSDLCIVKLTGRVMAHAVSRRSLTAESRVRARVNPFGVCGGQSGTGTGFLRVFSVFPCQYHSTKENNLTEKDRSKLAAANRKYFSLNKDFKPRFVSTATKILLYKTEVSLRIQSVPQREHHTSPLQRSTG